MPRTTSRETIVLVESIRSGITTGRYASGHYLPTIRALSHEFGVSAETVRRGLKFLEQDGLLVSEPRQGFRVLGTVQASRILSPIAYITEFASDLSNAQPANWSVNQALQNVAAARNWTVFGAHMGSRNNPEILRQVLAARAWAIILDAHSPEFLQTVLKTALPIVMVNSWIEEADVDVVIQDNYRGGYLAAKYLIKAGVDRIAWIQHSPDNCHSRARYAGATAALLSEEKALACSVRKQRDIRAYETEIRRVLSGPNRADGVLTFWKGATIIIKRIANELGLEINKDLKLVGWSVEEFYETEHRNLFPDGSIPPAIVWSATQMAQMAVECLEQRQEHPDRKPVRITLPTRLKFETM